MNLFERATRQCFRFPSVKGDLTVEQLWDLPLVNKSPTRDVKADLDTVARTINSELKSMAEESFVSTNPNPRKGVLEAQLEIVKHIIAVRLSEAEAAAKRMENIEKRSKLIEALAAKEDQELSQMSKDEIVKQLEALNV
jgi:hypothetical protein